MSSIIEFLQSVPVLTGWLGLALFYILATIPGMFYYKRNWNTKFGAITVLSLSPFYFAFAAIGQDYFWIYISIYSLTWWFLIFYDLELSGRTTKMGEGGPFIWMLPMYLWIPVMVLGIVLHYVWIFDEVVTFFKTDLSIGIWLLFGLLYFIVTNAFKWNVHKIMLIILFLSPVYFCWSAFSQPYFWSHLAIFSFSWWVLWLDDVRHEQAFAPDYFSFWESLKYSKWNTLLSQKSGYFWFLCTLVAIGYHLFF
ncbi:hypothetical protein AAG747_03750 [Rapidithrix thailandica]|uniref:Uncharacterized protein n=1 Tax=Rapidithrix thailandica TaxID=413964 RepID=A0AAW9S3K9_9BACT